MGGKPSQGCSDDLMRATMIAKMMVTHFGSKADYSYATGMQFSTPSNQIQVKIENEIQKILHEEYKRAKYIIKRNRNKMKNLIDLLLEKETIYEEDIAFCFGKRFPKHKNMEDQTNTWDWKTIKLDFVNSNKHNLIYF